MNARVVVGSLLTLALSLNVKDVAHENEDALDEQTIVFAPVLPVLREYNTIVYRLHINKHQ